MNTAEKYVCAYIISAITDIEGTNPDRVKEVILNTDYHFDSPLLDAVYNIAKADYGSESNKELVALLLATYIEDQNRKAEAKLREPEVSFSYGRADDDHYVCIVWFNLTIAALAIVPNKNVSEAIRRFREKYPDGNVICADG